MHSSDVTLASESMEDTKAGGSEENVKPKKISCFDFDDAEDANLGSELEERAKKFVENRKISRIVDDKTEALSKRWNVADDIKPLPPIPKVEPLTETSAVETIKTEIDAPSVVSEDIDTAFKTLLEETTVPALPEVPELPSTNVTSPVLEVGSSSSLPDVVLNSNNSHTVLDTNSFVPTVSELTNVESSGGDHDYSIKKEEEELQGKPEESKLGSIKVDDSEPQGTVRNAHTALEDEDMELDINSMPVVMTDAIITEEPEANNIAGVSVPMIDLIPSSTESQPASINEGGATVTNVTTDVSSSKTCVVVSKSSLQVSGNSGSANMKAAQGIPVKTVQVQQSAAAPASSTAVAAVTSAAVSAISKLKGTGGTTVISKKGHVGGKLVIVQASPGQQSRYTVGKTTQQRVTQQHIMQQAVGGSKVVILTKPQGSGQQKILTTALSPHQQRILTAGGKLQAQPQRLVTSTGAILNPRSVVTKGTKLTPISQQQMRALQSGKQTLGTKFTMQSTQAKVILPTMQKASVAQGSPVRVIGTLKPQSNTILIQTTQGTTVSGTVLGKPVATTIGQLQANISTSQSITRLSSPKPKMLTNPGIASSVQRVSVSTTGGSKIVQSAQTQSKVFQIRPTVSPGMVVQKVQSPLPAKAGSVGLLTNVSQVKKVSGIFPRAPSIQKLSQTTSQKMSALQSVQKAVTSSQTTKNSVPQQRISDVNIASKQIPVVVSTTNLQSNAEISSLQPLQPSVTVALSIQQNLVLSTQSNIKTADISVGQGSTISLPSLQPTSVAGTSVLTPQQLAQVVAATPAEQLGDSGTATYVLVTIDDPGTLQSYDNSTLLTYDGGSQVSEGAARTLYIDPSSISATGDLENIILAIDNSASSSGTVLNLGQANTMPVNPVTSIAVENSSASSVFNIVSAPHVSGTTATQSSSPNQDILAEALANTQVFQPDSAIPDSLTVVNSSQSTVMTPRLLEPPSLLTSSPSTLHQATMLLPSLSSVLPPPSNTAGVLETSLTLNQPIMSPLEVPSTVLPTLQAPPTVPASLELPLTITQPALSVTSQSYPSIPVTVSSHNSCSLSENTTAETVVSSSSMSLTMIERSTDSAANFNPSMPLLSEETDSQSEIDDGSPVVPPNSGSPAKPESHSDTSYSQDPENISDGVIQDAVSSHVEDVITSSATGHPALTSYTVVPEGTCQDKENHMNELSDIQSSLDLTSHHQHSGSTLETVAHSNERQTLPEIQSALGQTVSIVHDHVSGSGDILDSTLTHCNSTPEGTSEAAVEDNSTSDTNHSSSSHLASDHSSNTSYDHVSESISELSGPLASSQTEVAATLPSFTEITDGMTDISDNAIHKLGMNPTTSDETTFENNSEIPSDSSSSQLQADRRSATSDEYVRHACYLQIPESTSAEEKIVTNNSSEEILDSSQITCNTQDLTSFHKDFEDTSEVPEATSDLETEKEVTFTSYPTESMSSNVTTDIVPSESICNVPHSMPLLVDEPMTEMSSDCIEPEQALGRKSPLREDDMEITEEIGLKQRERTVNLYQHLSSV
ncbi:hypothetical protein L798_06066 [Zootermopsis nevadensis]|uniref:Uncharacterized protein n=1 Tax=Zootermopsis nevadensis TaxID=136037 RepID=A0A067R9J2_ZOONE|nr:hypothetical protein L798_06066 [Zootermopsis nevadensis]